VPPQTLSEGRPSSPEARSPRVQEKRRRKRAEILHAALRAFREKGYHATTLDDIAERVGVRKTALYHYFPDKQAILYECHRESVAELGRIMAEAERLPRASDKLAHVIREHVRLMTETLGGSPLAFEVTALSEDRHASLIAGRDRYERKLRRIIDQGLRDGEFRKGDSKVAVFVVLGAINWISRWYRPEGALRSFDLGEGFVEHLMSGLTQAPRSTPARRKKT
jgi:TetR/AcrR family transcriptional regulator